MQGKAPRLAKRWTKLCTFVSTSLALLLPFGALQAQFTLLEGKKSSLELGGYFRSLTGLYDQGFRIPGEDRR